MHGIASLILTRLMVENNNSGLYCKLSQMIQEDLQADIICHDDLSTHAAWVRVGGRGVQPRQQEPSLTSILVTDDQLGNRESMLHNLFCMSLGSLHRHINVSPDETLHKRRNAL